MAKKKRIMRSFKLDEISAVDRPAQQGATMILMKRKGSPGYDPKNKDPKKRGRDDSVSKDFMEPVVVLTSADSGHAHAVWLHPGEKGGTTSHGQDPEDDFGHSHAWRWTEEGGIVIGQDSGHDHIVSDEEIQQAFMSVGVQRLRLVIVEQLAGMFDQLGISVGKREELAEKGHALPDGSFPIVEREDVTQAVAALGRAPDATKAARHIQKRAKELEATGMLPGEGKLADLVKQEASQAADDIGKDREDDMTVKDDQKKAADTVKAAEKRAAEAEARAAKAEALVSMSDTQRSFYNKLEGDEAKESFLKLDSDGRNAEIRRAEDANKVVYKAEDGTEYRANDDSRLVALAKRGDQQDKELAEAKKSAQDASYAKRAVDELQFIPGDIDTRIEMLKAVDAIPDEAQRTKALDALKAQNTNLGRAFQTYGSAAVPQGDTTEKADAEGRIETLAKTHHAKHPELTYEQAYDHVIQQPEGAALYTKSLGPLN